MENGHKVIVWFDEVGKGDLNLVGGKGANLGELTRSGIPVPPGFIVTSHAYFDFLTKSGRLDQLQGLLDSIDPNNNTQLQKTAEEIQQIIRKSPMPPEISEGIKQSYIKIGRGMVAVRSSATAEDLPEASFAGQQRTFLNIHGSDDVVAAVQDCWASLFEARAIFYRIHHHFDHLKIGIAVPVQRMVQSEASGVMFTLEPVTNNQMHIVIEAIRGLGEAIVSGEVTPDLYKVDKKELRIIDKKISKQEWKLMRNAWRADGHSEANVKVEISPSEQGKQNITDKEILALAHLGKQIEAHYNFPQDIEWAIEGNKVYILQTRPVTTVKPLDEGADLPELQGEVILTGFAASPGVAVGRVQIVADPSEIDKVKPGDILVAEITTPDYVPAMEKAAAIVTDRGGKTSHAAIVSREMGIPCVVGTGEATKQLANGTLITVDGGRGKIYKGNVVTEEFKSLAMNANGAKQRLNTLTRVYAILGEPGRAAAVAARDVDGVGLLRAEFMILHRVKEHPQYMLSQGRGNEFIEKLGEGVATIAKAFNPRPVVYRATDFKTNEYRSLKGGEAYEKVEENPMIGYRGCSRYVTEVDVFKLEIEAIKAVRKTYNNVWMMIPFVRTVEELAQTKRILEKEGLHQSSSFKLWMMAEVPSNVFLIDQFIDTGIDGISIGSNDLTQLILGIDRDSERLADKFDERNDAVLIALETLIKAAAKAGITSSICGQAPSNYPELTEKLVEWGITSVSVNLDMIEKTRKIIADVESRLITPARLRRLERSWD